MWRFLKELKVELPFDPAIPLLGIYLEEKKSLHRKTLFSLSKELGEVTGAGSKRTGVFSFF